MHHPQPREDRARLLRGKSEPQSRSPVASRSPPQFAPPLGGRSIDTRENQRTPEQNPIATWVKSSANKTSRAQLIGDQPSAPSRLASKADRDQREQADQDHESPATLMFVLGDGVRPTGDRRDRGVVRSAARLGKDSIALGAVNGDRNRRRNHSCTGNSVGSGSIVLRCSGGVIAMRRGGGQENRRALPLPA